MKTRFKLFGLLVVLLLSTTGCFYKTQVSESQVGLILEEGRISRVVGAGRHTDWSRFASLEHINVSAQTASWEDPDLVTRDKQPIGFLLSVTYARERDSESITQMWQQFNSEARDDAVLQTQVLTRIPRIAKALTTKFTLDEILGVSGDVGRAAVQAELFDLLAEELAKINVSLIDVGINNISPSPDYLKLLEEKANATVAVEVARQNTILAEEQLLQERAQTEIDLELARRNNLVAEERAKVYETSPEYLQLEMLTRYADIFEGDNVWFLDPNMKLTVLFSDDGTVQPVPVPQAAPSTGQ